MVQRIADLLSAAHPIRSGGEDSPGPAAALAAGIQPPNGRLAIGVPQKAHRRGAAALHSGEHSVHKGLGLLVSGIRLSTLKVDGGAAANNYLLQTQADISNAPVERPSSVETTALGAAYLAGLAVGFWSGPEELAKKHAIDKMFVPDISEEERRKRLRGWHKAVRCAYNWARDDDEDE